MAELVHIAPNQLDYVWPKVADVLARAVGTNKGEESLGQVRLKLRQGLYDLLVYADEDEVLSVGVVDFINYPNVRVANLAYVSGSTSRDMLDAFKGWARVQGASQIQAFCGDSQSRLFQRYGFGHAYNVLRASL
jgi:hypothetical protein